MSDVCVHNEWDPLEEVIVGTAVGARIPRPEVSGFTIEFAAYGDPSRVPSGPFPAWLIEEQEAALDRLAETLRSLGVVVRRPEPFRSEVEVRTPYWSTDGQGTTCPRDVLLTIGDLVVEAPMVLRPRLWEADAYRDILLDYFRSGARWIAAPRPRMLDESYGLTPDGVGVLNDLEPMFDAANVLRSGEDILYLVSAGGNELGADWLESVLGPRYRVHRCRDMYDGTHLDSTIALLRPGLALFSPDRVTELTIPEPLRKWDHIWCPPMVEAPWLHEHPYTSRWIGMNLFMVNPDLAVVDKNQTALIRELEAHGIDVCPLELPHVRSVGGGFHCVTLDVRRRGELADYR